MGYDNEHDVIDQMEAFGIVLRTKDRALKVDSKKHTCGLAGKFWYKFHEFLPRTGGCLIVGSFGSYKEGTWQKVDVDWKGMAEEERERMKAQRDAAERKAQAQREQEAQLAAMGARELWAKARPEGESPYLQRKGLVGEACRYLPDGSLVLPLIRYDLPRTEALRGVQRIYADGSKRFTKDFAKLGCALRLGEVKGEPREPVLICEGYATGLSIRAAIERRHAVFVALDAGNLEAVAHVVRGAHRKARILVCADDDWQTKDHKNKAWNPGREKARDVIKHVSRSEMVCPVFKLTTRGKKDTDFNDLHAREGLAEVAWQLNGVLAAMRRWRAE